MDNRKRAGATRFALALPPDVNEAIRALAAGTTTRPPSSLNDAIVFVLRLGLKALAEQKPGNRAPAQRAVKALWAGDTAGPGGR